MTTPLAPLSWKRLAPQGGYYGAIGAEYLITRVWLDDGPWWIVQYPDGTTGDPVPTLAAAKAFVEADRV